MKFHHDIPWKTGEAIGALEGEGRREQLAVLLGQVLGTYGPWLVGEEMDRVARFMPDEKRNAFLEECADIAKEVGWEYATEVLLEARAVERRIRSVGGFEEESRFYPIRVQRPDEISTVQDFVRESEKERHDSREVVSYWVPTKRDIRRCVTIAEAAKETTGKKGPIRILEVGGGSGFLSRLIADEMKTRDLPCEVTVVDPDQSVINAARTVHRDCEQLRFETGTARTALEMFGPGLDSNAQLRLKAYERAIKQIQEEANERLGRVKATLETMEAWTTLDEALATPYGNAMREAFRSASVSLHEAEVNMESVRERLVKYFNSEYSRMHAACIKLKDRIEELYLVQGERREDGPDLVLNSWMPVGIDFTREIRMIGAPAILYAVERAGATGIDFPEEGAQSVADETSYQTGRMYKNTGSWDGLAATGFSGGLLRGYTGSTTTVARIQARTDIPDASSLFVKPSVPDTDRYAWEASIERLVGKETMERGCYANPIDPWIHPEQIALKARLRERVAARIGRTESTVAE